MESAYQAFAVQGDPLSVDFKVLSINPPDGTDADRFAAGDCCKTPSGRSTDPRSGRTCSGTSTRTTGTRTIIPSPKPQKAFRIDEGAEKVRGRYGKTRHGQRLLARRMVEAGARIITVNEPVGWDIHVGSFARLKTNLPVVDRAVGALLDDLSERGC